MHRRLYMPLAASFVAVLLAAGCSQSPQDRYNDAVGSLKNARNKLNTAQTNVTTARQQMVQAQQAFQQAQQTLESRQKNLQQAEQQVTKTATDQVLFRVLQKDVLSKSPFKGSAISIGVDQSVVTLTGAVPDQQTRQKAVQMVQSQPGVSHVIDNLTISQSGKSAPDSSGNAS